jgi:hypothetical protein
MDKKPQPSALQQRTRVVEMILVVVFLLVFVQLWLLMMALEESMAGGSRLVLPAFGASAFCFGLNLLLLKHLLQEDREET